jgi:hypothetical protein|tara:strand:- start:2894 stop:3796 length:903 start_codon:yes stop_codon:yes gene_type:complete
MVDVDSALRASAYSGKKKRGGGDKEDKPSTVLEPFDPAAHAQKEKAEAISMWLVIVYGLVVAVLMRYSLMPSLEGTQQILWLLPVLLMATVQPLHRTLVPSRFYNLYTRGNWFRACFLYLFTWLALSFALVNPPLADIAAPHLAGGLDIEATDGIAQSTWKQSTYSIQINQDSIPVVLGFAVRDNVDAGNSTMSLTITQRGQPDPLAHAEGLVKDQAAPSAVFDGVGEWQRGLWKNTLSGEFAGPLVAPNSLDIGMAWDLGTIGPGEYFVQIELVENGAPWSTGQNTWSNEYRLLITQVA